MAVDFGAAVAVVAAAIVVVADAAALFGVNVVVNDTLWGLHIAALLWLSWPFQLIWLACV